MQLSKRISFDDGSYCKFYINYAGLPDCCSCTFLHSLSFYIYDKDTKLRIQFIHNTGTDKKYLSKLQRQQVIKVYNQLSRSLVCEYGKEWRMFWTGNSDIDGSARTPNYRPFHSSIIYITTDIGDRVGFYDYAKDSKLWQLAPIDGRLYVATHNKYSVSNDVVNQILTDETVY